MARDTARSSKKGPGRRLGYGHGLAMAASLVAWGAARADGFRFEGDLPGAPHVLVDLSEAQRGEIRRAAGGGRSWPFPEVRLTEAQRAAIRAAGGADARWVFAARREALEWDCTCGIYNLGVVAGTKLAVLLQGLGDHLAPSDLASLEAALVDRGLAAEAPDPEPSVVHADADAGGASEHLRALAARFPGNAFERRLVLREGWSAQRLRLAAVPRVGFDGHIEEAALLSLSAVRSRPAPGNTIAWPELGARLEADGRVYLIVPGYVAAELGPPDRAWFLLEYREGKLAAAVVPGLARWTGMVVEWEASGDR
jgi:hypothetical protein